jgi:hypothetical protein
MERRPDASLTIDWCAEIVTDACDRAHASRTTDSVNARSGLVAARGGGVPCAASGDPISIHAAHRLATTADSLALRRRGLQSRAGRGIGVRGLPDSRDATGLGRSTANRSRACQNSAAWSLQTYSSAAGMVVVAGRSQRAHVGAGMAVGRDFRKRHARA